jgi:hypothetical protein
MGDIPTGGFQQRQGIQLMWFLKTTQAYGCHQVHFLHTVSYSIYLFITLKSNITWLYCIVVTKLILALLIINGKCTVWMRTQKQLRTDTQIELEIYLPS